MIVFNNNYRSGTYNIVLINQKKYCKLPHYFWCISTVNLTKIINYKTTLLHEGETLFQLHLVFSTFTTYIGIIQTRNLCTNNTIIIN